jgi:hypothetical protein
MGIHFGDNTGNFSFNGSARLARKIERRGGRSSTGASTLLDMMACRTDPGRLRGEEAEQAAASIRQVAGKLGRKDRATALAIAEDAQDAADSGGGWTLRG